MRTDVDLGSASTALPRRRFDSQGMKIPSVSQQQFEPPIRFDTPPMSRSDCPGPLHASISTKGAHAPATVPQVETYAGLAPSIEDEIRSLDQRESKIQESRWRMFHEFTTCFRDDIEKIVNEVSAVRSDAIRMRADIDRLSKETLAMHPGQRGLEQALAQEMDKVNRDVGELRTALSMEAARSHDIHGLKMRVAELSEHRASDLVVLQGVQKMVQVNSETTASLQKQWLSIESVLRDCVKHQPQADATRLREETLAAVHTKFGHDMSNMRLATEKQIKAAQSAVQDAEKARQEVASQFKIMEEALNSRTQDAEKARQEVASQFKIMQEALNSRTQDVEMVRQGLEAALNNRTQDVEMLRQGLEALNNRTQDVEMVRQGVANQFKLMEDVIKDGFTERDREFRFENQRLWTAIHSHTHDLDVSALTHGAEPAQKVVDPGQRVVSFSTPG